MCCFSQPVESVTATKIFARESTKNRQFVVYSMTLAAEKDLAMILPLPVPAKSPEDAVRFINLEKYEKFFADMAKGFPATRGPSKSETFGLGGLGNHKLEVVEVGSFVASFVPTVADFARLDEQFRLPNGTWDKLPAYKEFGFAVFKLKPGEKTIHPMAFEFPRATRRLFFPTVHIHDGEVHEQADFDHVLYMQAEQNAGAMMQWQESPQLAASFMKIDDTAGIVDGKQHIYRLKISGKKQNRDIYV